MLPLSDTFCFCQKQLTAIEHERWPSSMLRSALCPPSCTAADCKLLVKAASAVTASKHAGRYGVRCGVRYGERYVSTCMLLVGEATLLPDREAWSPLPKSEP